MIQVNILQQIIKQLLLLITPEVIEIIMIMPIIINRIKYHPPLVLIIQEDISQKLKLKEIIMPQIQDIDITLTKILKKIKALHKLERSL